MLRKHVVVSLLLCVVVCLCLSAPLQAADNSKLVQWAESMAKGSAGAAAPAAGVVNPSTYQWYLQAQATPDECFQGNANNGLTQAQVQANYASFLMNYPAGLSPAQIASCIAAGYLPKVNQAYVWGLTTTGNNVWFSTIANTLCLVLDAYYGFVPAPYQNNDWVCDLKDGEDTKSARVFVFNSATNVLTDLTPAIVATADKAILLKTYGIRSAGNFGGVVFFGGLTTGSNNKSDVVLFAFNAQTQAYLGSYVFDGSDDQHPYYSNIRQWHVVNNQLFFGVGMTGGGQILRWTGSVASPFSFVVVGQLGGDAAYFTAHQNHIYVSTWGAVGQTLLGQGVGMSIYMSPTFHGSTVLDDTDVNNWTEVWNLNQYEVEPTAVQAGGAIESFNGNLYWGTMHVPGTGLVAFHALYPDATINTEDFLGSYRPIVIFRSAGFDPTANPSPSVQLLYGSTELPKYDPTTDSWSLVQNNLGQTPLYGMAGINNFFNNYTWSMAVFQNQLFIGTMDWSYLAADYTQVSQYLPGAVSAFAPAFYGADLWAFADSNSPAVPISLDGMGNNTSYGIRNLVPDANNNLWIGMANPMNLRTDPTNDPGGWKLIRLPAQSTSPVITWSNPAAITYGTPLSSTQLNATASVPGTFTYRPPAGAVLNLGQNQQLSATFTPTNSGNQWTTTVSINVLPATPTITITAGTFNVDANPHPATAVAIGAGGVTVNGTMAITYNGYSTVPVASGAYTVNASFVSSDPNYTNASGTAQLTILASPAITITNTTTTTTPTVTVSAGQTGSFQFTLGSVGPVTGAITLACSGLPTGAQCQFSPPSVDASNLPTTVTVTISTTSLTLTARNWSSNGLWAMAMCLPGLLLLPINSNQRKRRNLWIAIGLVLILTIALFGCGSSPQPAANPNGTPTGTYHVSVTASATSATQSATNFNLVVTP